MPVSPVYSPSRRHAELGPDFYDAVRAAEFTRHDLRWRNDRWAARVGLDELTDAEWLDHFGRFAPLPGSFEQPLALRYHGHQFRSYNPDLGDGRGFLFAQLRDAEDGRLLDLATKGSGRTPWSRTADGRLTLKGGVRELLATEMLEALGVDTSKTFSLVETGEELWRGDESSPTRSCVLTRLSHSHIRIGSFQRLLYLDQHDNVARLMDHVVRTYFTDVWVEDTAARALAFLEEVGRRVARTGARWMTAGFVHGVLNTDNINVTGESFDYGPWRFAPVLDPAFTAAYFDETRLYAFGRQPDTLLWNLTRLAECLLPLAPQDGLMKVLEGFGSEFRARFAEAMRWRLGLEDAGEKAAQNLVGAVWRFLEGTRMPFERFFFDWRGGMQSSHRAGGSAEAATYAGPVFDEVREALMAHEPVERALSHSYFASDAPCTMLIDEVEALWAPIATNDDWSPLKAKIAAIGVLREAYSEAVVQQKMPNAKKV
ncbi:MAG: YdiU family protein [Rhizobiaceae bacterium]|nr:YdiU family protein [Rhizobiaceae bacterium]